MLFLPLDQATAKPRFKDYFPKDTSHYMLTGLLGRDAQVTERQNIWSVATDKIPQHLVVALKNCLKEEGELDTVALRRLHNEHYLATIPSRGQDPWIKPTVAELAAATGYKKWPYKIEKFSKVKHKSRRIYRSPADFLTPMSVSETLDSTVGDEGAHVLDIEVAIRRFDSQNWDLYPYNEEGYLSDKAVFSFGERAAPEACISCHYSDRSRQVERVSRRSSF